MADVAHELAVGIDDIRAAAARLAGVAHRTPVLTSRTLDARTNARVFLKAENFQRMGAFKFRGAYNRLAQLTDDERRRGVVAFSTAITHKAWPLRAVARCRRDDRDAGRCAGGETRRDARLRRRGHHVRSCDEESRRARRDDRRRARRGRRAALRRSERIVAGQGTAALELIEETGPLDVLARVSGRRRLSRRSAIAATALAQASRSTASSRPRVMIGCNRGTPTRA